MNKRIKFSAVAVLLFAALPAFSHDYWFVPEIFFAPERASIGVRLIVGDEFKIQEERPLQKEKTSRFQMFSAERTEDLLTAGTEGQNPVTRLTVGASGNYLIAMERKNQPITLEAKKFTDYLTEEGLDGIVAERRQRGESQKAGRERYSRYLKLLLQIGDRHDETYKRVVGQRLEIIPQANPYEMKLGDRLRVRVFFDTKPLAGAKVFAYSHDGGAVREQAVKTSSEGLVEFTIDKPGEWLVRLVYMRRCEKCDAADWESFWGAYSFGVK